MKDTAYAAHAPVSPTPDAADVLAFWFGAPAETTEQLLKKFHRWYEGGPSLDREIGARFGALVDAAIVGELDAWRSSVSGRLALLILLDQFTRNMYRGTPRAYCGDSAAIMLALDTIDSGLHRSYSLEERLFVMMPLVHAESVALLSRAVLLADEMVSDAPDSLREPWAFGAQRVRKYRSLIERFGRFPARNAILARASSAAELAYLAEERQAASPLAALDERLNAT